MGILKQTNYFAAYSDGAYGASEYNFSGTSTTPGGGSDSSGGGLADTGFDVLLPIFLGISLVFASSILLAKKWLRSRRQRQQQAS